VGDLEVVRVEVEVLRSEVVEAKVGSVVVVPLLVPLVVEEVVRVVVEVEVTVEVMGGEAVGLLEGVEVEVVKVEVEVVRVEVEAVKVQGMVVRVEAEVEAVKMEGVWVAEVEVVRMAMVVAMLAEGVAVVVMAEVTGQAGKVEGVEKVVAVMVVVGPGKHVAHMDMCDHPPWLASRVTACSHIGHIADVVVHRQAAGQERQAANKSGCRIL
jgi:hypothetical protein